MLLVSLWKEPNKPFGQPNKIVIMLSAAVEKYMCAMKMLNKREITLLSKWNCAWTKTLRKEWAWVNSKRWNGRDEAGVTIVNDEAGELGKSQTM